MPTAWGFILRQESVKLENNTAHFQLVNSLILVIIKSFGQKKIFVLFLNGQLKKKLILKIKNNFDASHPNEERSDVEGFETNSDIANSFAKTPFGRGLETDPPLLNVIL